VNISRVLDHTIQGIGQVTHVYAKYDFLETRDAELPSRQSSLFGPRTLD